MGAFEWFGLISGIILSASAIPQAFKVWRANSTRGLSPSFIYSWFVGSLCTGGYLVAKLGLDPAVLGNYGICIVCASVVLGVHIKNRRKNGSYLSR